MTRLARRSFPLASRLGLAFVVGLAPALAGTAAAGPVKVYFTTPFPGSVPAYACNGMSSDGRTAVGWVDNPLSMSMFDQAWLLTPCQTNPLPDLGFGSYAYGVSDNAKTVVGSIVNPFTGGGTFIPVRWDFSAGYAYTALPTLGGASAEATAITPDGNIIVGVSQDATGQLQGFYSAFGAPPVGVGALPGYTNNLLVAVAPDASAAVGHAYNSSGARAVWFRPGAGLTLLPNPPGGVFQYAVSVSSAPNLVVGQGTIGNTTRALVSDGVNTFSLGTLPGDLQSNATGISPDGSTVIGTSSGTSSSPLTISRTFVFTAATGMVDLRAGISAVYGYNWGPWWLPLGRSTSGLRAFAGTAVNTSTGDYAGYLIQICPADFNRDGVTDMADFPLFLAAYNAGKCEADLNGDGLVNAQDVTEFRNSVTSGC